MEFDTVEVTHNTYTEVLGPVFTMSQSIEFSRLQSLVMDAFHARQDYVAHNGTVTSAVFRHLQQEYSGWRFFRSRPQQRDRPQFFFGLCAQYYIEHVALEIRPRALEDHFTTQELQIWKEVDELIKSKSTSPIAFNTPMRVTTSMMRLAATNYPSWRFFTGHGRASIQHYKTNNTSVTYTCFHAVRRSHWDFNPDLTFQTSVSNNHHNQLPSRLSTVVGLTKKPPTPNPDQAIVEPIGEENRSIPITLPLRAWVH